MSSYQTSGGTWLFCWFSANSYASSLPPLTKTPPHISFSLFYTIHYSVNVWKNTCVFFEPEVDNCLQYLTVNLCVKLRSVLSLRPYQTQWRFIEFYSLLGFSYRVEKWSSRRSRLPNPSLRWMVSAVQSLLFHIHSQWLVVILVILIQEMKWLESFGNPSNTR